MARGGAIGAVLLAMLPAGAALSYLVYCPQAGALAEAGQGKVCRAGRHPLAALQGQQVAVDLLTPEPTRGSPLLTLPVASLESSHPGHVQCAALFYPVLIAAIVCLVWVLIELGLARSTSCTSGPLSGLRGACTGTLRARQAFAAAGAARLPLPAGEQVLDGGRALPLDLIRNYQTHFAAERSSSSRSTSPYPTQARPADAHPGRIGHVRLTATSTPSPLRWPPWRRRYGDPRQNLRLRSRSPSSVCSSGGWCFLISIIP